jgi:DTW domain-containing protein YfiP
MKKINLQDYLLKRQIFELLKPNYRNLCTTCLHPEFSCYCPTIKSFDPLIQFVILIHPIEFQRRIATGRMSHLILKNSILIKGQDYSTNVTVNSLIQDQKNECVVLYPGKNSTNLSDVVVQERKKIFQKNKKLVVFVIDGTWATARQMMRHSLNLTNLPRVCFTPTSQSNFRVRKQPESFCLSTIEAIHQFIEISGAFVGFQTDNRQHDILLKVFNQMVERQIQFVKKYS